MTKKPVLVLTALAAILTAGHLYAGTLENAAAKAGEAFALSLTGKALSAAPAAMARRQTAVLAAVDEFQKLAKAFEKGTAPKKEELSGWLAGRILEKGYAEYPGSMLLAATGDKLVVLTLYAGPTFYENLSPDLAAGVKVFIEDFRKDWSAPQFGPAGTTFERTLPSYEKGFSRYEVRKAADGTLLLKHVWERDLGGSVSKGVEYGFVTKNVTPQ